MSVSKMNDDHLITEHNLKIKRNEINDWVVKQQQFEAKAAKRDDPQTQADLKLASTVKEVFESQYTIRLRSDEEDLGFHTAEDLVGWWEERKGERR